jgi:phosphate transport system substrate-binding protein
MMGCQWNAPLRWICLFVAIALTQQALGQGVTIKGAGATFPADVYAAWGVSYTREKNVGVEYLPTGSGDGIKRILEKSVDFGGTDVPLPEKDLAARGLVQFPTLLGGVVPVVNLPGLRPGQLRLSGQVLAEIFSGRIAAWNDPRIRKLNPDLALPAANINRVVREDSSGSTRAFTEYLSTSSAEWKSQIGAGMTVPWPGTAQKAKGNDGISQAVRKTVGSIGYVSYTLVLKDRMTYATLQNRGGRWVTPSEEAFRAAAQASDLGTTADEQTRLIDLAGPFSWPITEITFVVLDGNPKDSKRAAHVLRFFYWVFQRGDDMASGTGFVALPTRIQARVISRLTKVKSAEGKSLLLDQVL